MAVFVFGGVCSMKKSVALTNYIGFRVYIDGANP
jgi:hypothetical protein